MYSFGLTAFETAKLQACLYLQPFAAAKMNNGLKQVICARVENIERKGENAGYQLCSRYQECFFMTLFVKVIKTLERVKDLTIGFFFHFASFSNQIYCFIYINFFF